MTIQKARAWAAGVIVALLLASCGGGAPPPDTFYRLPDNPPPAAADTIPGTLEVQPVRADGLLNDRAVVYSDGESVLRKYSYHFWTEPPSSMIQTYLIDRLRAAGVFERISQPEMRVDRDYDLRGALKRFEHVTSGGPSRVVVRIEFSLRRIRGGETVLLEAYEEEEPVRGSSVSRAVDGFAAAMDRIYQRLERDITALEL